MKELAAQTPGIREAEWEKDGVAWAGLEMPFGEIKALNDRAAPDGMNEEAWAELKAALRSLSVVVACAEVDGFLVMTAALGREAVVLAERPEESLAAREAFGFHKQFEADRSLPFTQSVSMTFCFSSPDAR